MAKSGAIRAGRAFVELFSDNNPLVRGLRSAEQRVKQFGNKVQAIGRRVAAAGAAITAPILLAAREFAKAGDSLDKMAARTGVSVEALSTLGFAAEISGSNIEALGSALFRMRRRVANAAEGTGPAIRALRELGFEAEALTQLPVEEQFKQIADRLSEMQNPSEAAQYAFEILGDGAKALIPLLQQGRERIEALEAEARSLGLEMSSEAATGAADLTDALTRMRFVFNRIVQVVGEAVAPIITEVTTIIARNAATVIAMVKEYGRAIVVALGVGAALTALGGTLIAVALTIKAMGVVVGVLAGVLGGVLSLLGALLTPLGLVAAALGVVAVRSGGVGNVVRWLGDQLDWLREVAQRAFGAIGDALVAGDISAAANVLWTSLRLAWLKGTQDLSEQWVHFKRGFMEVFSEAVAGVRGAWAETQAWLGRQWINLTTTWKVAVEGLGQFFATTWARIRARFDEDFDLDFHLKHMEQQGETRQKQIQSEDAAARAEVDQERDRRLKQIAADHEAEMKGLAIKHGQELDEVGAAVEKARQEWEQAVEAARRARQEVEEGASAPPGMPDAGEWWQDFAAGFDDMTEDVRDQSRSGASVVGSFNPAALAGLFGGSGSPMERTAKATEAAAAEAKRTRKALENIEYGGAAFA